MCNANCQNESQVTDSLFLTLAGETNYEGGSHSFLLHLTLPAERKCIKSSQIVNVSLTLASIDDECVVIESHYTKQNYEGNTCFTHNLLLSPVTCLFSTVNCQLFHSQI